MTTYSLSNGFQVDWRDTNDHSDTVNTGYRASGSFTVVVGDGGGFTYVNEAQQSDGDIWAEVTVTDTYSFVVGDSQLIPYPSGDLYDTNVGFLDVTWVLGGKTYSSTLMDVALEYGDDSQGRMTGTDYYFLLAGDAFPAFSSIAEFDNFADKNLTSVTEVSGSFGEGKYIEWTDIADLEVVTEDDEMGGTNGNDVFNGGIGDDYFMSSKGADTYNGGAGWDQVAFHIDDPAGVYANLKTGLAVDGWGFSDTLNSIEMLRGSMYDDELIGSDGNDIMRGVKGRDDMDGGKGKHDEVRYDRDERYGGTDGVKVNLKKGFAIDGFGDRDKLKNFEDVRGTIYKDKLIGSNAKNEIEAGDGNDVIKGLGGRDKIYGGIGRDKIDGGKGKDNLWGDRGADKFIFKGKFGNDKIKDFETDNKGEKIVLKKIGAIESFDDLMNNHISDVNGSAVIEDGSGNSITIDGITMSELAANDFLF